uniref:hypothetical protein n=1 Tax=Lentilactobacillus hilgardii TaxID=1588 RepID=UPI00403F47C1
MDLNKLHDAWIEAGQKVTDLQEKRNQMAVELNDSPEKYSDEDLNKIADSIDKAKKARDFAKGAYDDALATAKLAKPGKPATGGSFAHKTRSSLVEILSNRVHTFILSPIRSSIF